VAGAVPWITGPAGRVIPWPADRERRPARPNARPSVCIVGGGFSGVLTALHLLALPKGPTIRLVERSPVFGRGVAFATANPNHLLNVRVANMSALPEQPDHFREWLAGHGGWSAHGGFVTRAAYGAYLQDLLRQAVRGAPAGRLLLDTDEVVGARPASRGWRLATRMGRSLEADALVLAVGLAPPAAPPEADDDLLSSIRYVADPWADEGRLAGLGPRVLLLGSGLTMIDVALALADGGRRLTALSRRGLTPRVHGAEDPADGEPAPRGSAAALTRHIRRRARSGDWRAAVDAVRPHVQAIWRDWPAEQQSRFLRHLRPWWDAHRHRMAPAVARQVETMVHERTLAVQAGQLVSLRAGGDGVLAAWRLRGERRVRRRTFDAVVNCTGPIGDLRRVEAPLLRSLMAQGLIRPDRWALGADVDAVSRPLDRHGRPREDFFAVGPLTRGQFWEITSVPDIRLQAAEVARSIAARLAWAAPDD
jgi:uncharacterized NAD(P)/FAD-binding protein YdhS